MTQFTITGDRVGYQVVVEREGVEYHTLFRMIEDASWTSVHVGHDLKLAVYIALRKASEIEEVYIK